MLKTILKLPIVMVGLFVLIMFVVASANIFASYSFRYQPVLSAVIFAAGLLIILAGAYSFRKAKTTVNPLTPEKSTQLVTTGVYAFSRNPMYIGFLAWLLSCAIFTGSVANLLFLPLYVILANRFHIGPEEKALKKLFGNTFEDYKKRVRRWI